MESYRSGYDFIEPDMIILHIYQFSKYFKPKHALFRALNKYRSSTPIFNSVIKEYQIKFMQNLQIIEEETRRWDWRNLIPSSEKILTAIGVLSLTIIFFCFIMLIFFE